MSAKPWLDVGTMAIARETLGRCIRSFLDHLSDRNDYRLRWICHLDQNGTGGMEDRWVSQLNEIVEASSLFDDFVLIANQTHVGYGGSFFRILREVRNGLLYTDDDQLFDRDIRVTDAIASGFDHYNWHNGEIAGTVPSYWTRNLVQYMLDHYPRNHKRITEVVLFLTAKRGVDAGELTRCYDPALGVTRGQWPSANIGRTSAAYRPGTAKYGPNRSYVGPDGQPHRFPRGVDILEFANTPDEEEPR